MNHGHETCQLNVSVIALALVFAGGQSNAATPPLVNAPPLNRGANLVTNGSFEEGHPGVVSGPAGSPSPDSVYWALVASGPHNPANRGDLALFPLEVELTPPGWSGSGGTGNYAEWSSQWPGMPQAGIGPTGPAFSTAPFHGRYSVYFGNYYMTSLNVPRNGIFVTPDGEWQFHDSLGARVDPVIVPGQQFLTTLPAASFRPEVRLAQTVTDLCPRAVYRLSFTVFGEYGHPEVHAALGPLAADGFFGLRVSGYDLLYLDVPAGTGLGPTGAPSPFGAESEHVYTIEFVALANSVDLTFINWGHFNRRTLLGGTPYSGVPPMRQTTEVVLDDVIMNGAVVCQNGTGTPGYWKNHAEAWPFDVITVGGIDYPRAQAIALMNRPSGGDVTYTLFRSLVAALLNELVGNDVSCVTATIDQADAWMALYPPGSGVKAGGRTSPWRTGEPLHSRLDAYNNGLLCAPHRI